MTPLRQRLRLMAAGLLIGVFAGGSGEAAARARPHHHAHRAQVGKASYYGPHHAGKTTASGTRMAPGKMTAASRTLPLGTKAKVTNLETGKSVAVTVEDRGPYAEHRILDLSSKAADKLDMKEDGVATVKVTPLSVPDKH